MLHFGVVSHNHDASVAMAVDSTLYFASQSERFSQIKNDPKLDAELCWYATKHYGEPDVIHYFEKPYNRNHLLNGRFNQIRTQGMIARELHNKFYLTSKTEIVFHDHHLSHAATACETSSFEEAVVVVMDAVGQNDCVSIYQYNNQASGKKRYKLLFRVNYPDSMGLFYTAMTERLGLKPNQDEYIVMALTDLGQPIYTDLLKDTFFKDFGVELKLKHNVHQGIGWFGNQREFSFTEQADLAASTQALFTEYVLKLIKHAKLLSGSENLALGGGCFLNGVTNHAITQLNLFKQIWINPNPGDGGSSIGAIALGLGRKIPYTNSFLGVSANHEPNIDYAIKALSNGIPIAICTGNAEFGPRALGHRSILFDPSIPNAQDIMNVVKRRQSYRPFAPVVLERNAKQEFELSESADYQFMQYVVPVKSNRYPGATMLGKTARVQVVSDSNNILSQILEAWEAKTGKTVLLNTSLNGKNQPITKDYSEATKVARSLGIAIA